MTVCSWCNGTGKNRYQHASDGAKGRGSFFTPCMFCQQPKPRMIEL